MIKIFGSERFRELIRYGIIGVCTTAVNFAVFFLLRPVLQVDAANVIAIVSSVLFAYITNKLFVFRSRAKNFKALIAECGSFFSSRAFTMMLEFAGVAALRFIILDWQAKIIFNVVVIVLNYILSKKIVFRDRGNEKK